MGRIHAVSGYLAETHVVLWFWLPDPRLSVRHRDFSLSETPVTASIASIWEVSIKCALGKLMAPDPLTAALEEAGLTLLPITPRHAEAVRHLPHHHGDPFDRMLIAQAQVEGLTLLTADRRFAAYDVAVV